MRVCGIDPGRDGGLAELTLSSSGLRCEALRRMPWDSTGLSADDLDAKAVLGFLTRLGQPALVVLEAQNYMGGAGDFAAASAAKLIRGYGELIGLCKVSDLKYHEVYPQAWQAVVLVKSKLNLPGIPKPATKGRPTADEKKASRAARAARRSVMEDALASWAKRTYPEADLTPGKCTKPHTGLVAALAIAHYGAVKVLGVTASCQKAKT